MSSFDALVITFLMSSSVVSGRSLNWTTRPAQPSRLGNVCAMASTNTRYSFPAGSTSLMALDRHISPVGRS